MLHHCFSLRTWRTGAALAALLPLISACGGAPTSTTSGAPQQNVVAPIATAAAGDSGGASDEPRAVAMPLATTVSAASEAPASAERSGAPAPSTAGDVIVMPTQATLPQQQEAAPLRAGDTDDNDRFDDYQEYLRSFYSSPGIRADISERYILTVRNERQQPVLDANVQIFDGAQQVFAGQTYAGGKTIYLPRAIGNEPQGQNLRVVVQKGNSTAEATLSRGQNADLTFDLPGAAALPDTPRLDVVFLLDATGSMGDEINQIQQTVTSIAQRIDRFEPHPEIRFGLVSYRDRGDDYVTRSSQFTPDVIAFQQELQLVVAAGGGDEPEALNEALHVAVQEMNWRDDAIRLVFLVADAPPHLDYPNDYNYVNEAQVAVARGIKIYPIAASNTDGTAEYVFRQLAQQTLAHFIFLTYQPGMNEGAPGDSTERHVDPDTFTVDRLDDIVVQTVQRELSRAVGAA